MDQISTNQKYDRLTGLYSRKVGIHMLSEFIAQADESNSKFYAVITDINELNIVNKTLGHDIGDQIIQKSAACFKALLRHHDFGIRLSGDEFLFVFLKTDRKEIEKRLNLAKKRLKVEHVTLCGEINFCYGIVEINTNQNLDVQQIIVEADSIMSHFKRRYMLDKAQKTNVLEDYVSGDKFIYDEEYLLDALLRSSDDYIFVCNMRDHPGTFRYSKSMVEEFEFPSEVIENTAEAWRSIIHEADHKIFQESNQEIADGVSDKQNIEYRALNKDGKWVWLRCRGQVIRDEKGEPVLFAGFITCLNRKNKVDHLTGLFNKFEFEDSVNQLIKNEQTKPFVVLLLDLDQFSSINKLYDNHFGDKILEITAQKIMSILPENAKTFRNIGDEFYVILQGDKSKEDIQNFYNELQECVKHQQAFEGKKYHCTISAGCIKFPNNASDFTSITKNVNYALEFSKKNGRNRLTFFNKDMLLEEMLDLDMSEQLRYSVEHDFEGFRLNYQPLVDAQTGHIVGMEALARWQCAMYGNVPPLSFIPILEKTGMIIPVGKWIFEEATKQCKKWTLHNEDLVINVNLSYLQLNDTDFVQFMDDILKKYDVNPRNIVVEMTESRIMATESIRDNFKRIRKLGIRIAMDDFGTGYSSLGALKSAPADIVKIDRVFMKNILVDEFDTTFIKFIIRLCDDVGIHVLLEGVETNEEYQKVKPLGLDFIQGYFFGKPMEKECANKLFD